MGCMHLLMVPNCLFFVKFTLLFLLSNFIFTFFIITCWFIFFPLVNFLMQFGRESCDMLFIFSSMFKIFFFVFHIRYIHTKRNEWICRGSPGRDRNERVIFFDPFLMTSLLLGAWWWSWWWWYIGKLGYFPSQRYQFNFFF